MPLSDLHPFEGHPFKVLDDELSLDTVGDKKTALFLIMSDTDPTFNFLISMIYTCLLYTSRCV